MTFLNFYFFFIQTDLLSCEQEQLWGIQTPAFSCRFVWIRQIYNKKPGLESAKVVLVVVGRFSYPQSCPRILLLCHCPLKRLKRPDQKQKTATLTFPFTTFTIRKVLVFVSLWTLNHSNELLLNSSDFPVVLFIMRQCGILKCVVQGGSNFLV